VRKAVGVCDKSDASSRWVQAQLPEAVEDIAAGAEFDEPAPMTWSVAPGISAAPVRLEPEADRTAAAIKIGGEVIFNILVEQHGPCVIRDYRRVGAPTRVEGDQRLADWD